MHAALRVVGSSRSRADETLLAAREVNLMKISRSIGLPLVWAMLAFAPPLGMGEASGMVVMAQSQTRSLLGRPSNLRIEAAQLGAALEELTRTSGVALAFSPSLLPGDLRVSCSCVSNSVAEALNTLLQGSGFDYREGDGQVILVPVRPPRLRTASADMRLPATGALGVVRTMLREDPLPSILVAEPFLVRAATITGSVTSEGGGAVVSAVVTLVRTQLSTTTDARGNYRIVVPTERIVAGSETLRVERIGFAPTDVQFDLRDGDIRVDVVMPLRAVPLEQIVVTGTAGNQERRAQSAVVGSIDAADIVRQAPINNVTQLLQSRLPGMSITESSGTTGSAARINIRGAASINLSNQPLVFLDGVRIEGGARSLVNVSGGATVGQAPSALNDLNPEDIESIEVVKGPAAATLYGADASAGVIQIITKKGRVGSRSFTQELTFEYGTIDPNFTVPTNYARCIAALVGSDSPNPLCRGQEVGTLITDNPAERINAFRDGSLKSFRYNGRGGGENYGFFASFGLTNEDGTTRNNLLKQRNGRVNFTFNPTSSLTFDANLALSRTEYDLPRTDQDAYGYYVQSIFGSPLTVSDNGPDGALNGGMLFANTSLESLSSIKSQVSALRATPSVQVRYAPVTWFTNRVTLGVDITQGKGFLLFPKNTLGWYANRQPAGDAGEVATNQDDDRTYTVEYLGNISSDFGPNGQFTSNFSFGSQYIHRVVNRLSGEGFGLATNAAYLVTNAASSAIGQSFAASKSLGLIAQEQIGYRDRLFLQLGLRADRNSAFGDEVGTFYLPKFGISYVISEEPFWDGLSTAIPTLRLRGAYGTTGRSPAAGSSLQTYSTAKFATDGGLLELGIVPGNPGNPDLKPERGKELEIGFDVAFLNDRVGGEVTYFNKKTTDLLVSVPAPPSGGFPPSLGNIGEVVNRGVEFLVRATPVSRPDVIWDLSVSGGTLHNEILTLGTVGTFVNNFRAFVPGRQVASWWVHRVRSIDETQGLTITSDTAEFAGNQLPTFQGNLTTSLTLFRNFRIYALFERKSGYLVYNLSQAFRDRSSRTSSAVNLTAEEGGYSATERLRRMGPYVGENSGMGVGAGNVIEPYLQSGDHVRFRELTATFSVPASLVERFGASGASLTVGGRNLGLWFADYEGDDPDVIGTGPQASGLNQFFNADVFTTPPTRRWFARLNLQF
jgi:TonB-linked SusC/RagA family outer membrane protein